MKHALTNSSSMAACSPAFHRKNQIHHRLSRPSLPVRTSKLAGQPLGKRECLLLIK